MSDVTYPNSWDSREGIVHAGERCIRQDLTSDWPWADCGKRLDFSHWVNAPVNCLWCIAGHDLGPYD